jgi:hypothetical protein
VTCIAALIRTPLNADERRRMRPQMSPPLRRGDVASAAERTIIGYSRLPDLAVEDCVT